VTFCLQHMGPCEEKVCALKACKGYLP